MYNLRLLVAGTGIDLRFERSEYQAPVKIEASTRVAGQMLVSTLLEASAVPTPRVLDVLSELAEALGGPEPLDYKYRVVVSVRRDGVHLSVNDLVFAAERLAADRLIVTARLARLTMNALDVGRRILRVAREGYSHARRLLYALPDKKRVTIVGESFSISLARGSLGLTNRRKDALTITLGDDGDYRVAYDGVHKPDETTILGLLDALASRARQLAVIAENVVSLRPIRGFHAPPLSDSEVYARVDCEEPTPDCISRLIDEAWHDLRATR